MVFGLPQKTVQIIVVLMVMVGTVLIVSDSIPENGYDHQIETLQTQIEDAQKTISELNTKKELPEIDSTWKKVQGLSDFYGLAMEPIGNVEGELAVYVGPLRSWNAHVKGNKNNLALFCGELLLLPIYLGGVVTNETGDEWNVYISVLGE